MWLGGAQVEVDLFHLEQTSLHRSDHPDLPAVHPDAVRVTELDRQLETCVGEFLTLGEPAVEQRPHAPEPQRMTHRAVVAQRVEHFELGGELLVEAADVAPFEQCAHQQEPALDEQARLTGLVSDRDHLPRGLDAGGERRRAECGDLPGEQHESEGRRIVERTSDSDRLHVAGSGRRRVGCHQLEPEVRQQPGAQHRWSSRLCSECLPVPFRVGCSDVAREVVPNAATKRRPGESFAVAEHTCEFPCLVVDPVGVGLAIAASRRLAELQQQCEVEMFVAIVVGAQGGDGALQETGSICVGHRFRRDARGRAGGVDRLGEVRRTRREEMGRVFGFAAGGVGDRRCGLRVPLLAPLDLDPIEGHLGDQGVHHRTSVQIDEIGLSSSDEQRLDVVAAEHRTDRLDRCTRPEHRHRADEVADGLSGSVEPSADDLAQCAVGPVGGGRQTRHLPHEERVASGRCVDSGRRERVGEQFGHIVHAETTEFDHADTSPECVQLGSDVCVRVCGIDGPVRRHDQHGRRGQAFGEEPEQRDRVGVGGMQVLDHENQWSSGRCLLHHLARRIEELETVRSARLAEHQLREVRPAVDTEQRPDDLHPGPVGRRRAVVPTTTPHHRDSGVSSGPGDLLGEPGLTDAGLADDQPTGTGGAGIRRDQIDHLGEFALSPDEILHLR